MNASTPKTQASKHPLPHFTGSCDRARFKEFRTKIEQKYGVKIEFHFNNIHGKGWYLKDKEDEILIGINIPFANQYLEQKYPNIH